MKTKLPNKYLILGLFLILFQLYGCDNGSGAKNNDIFAITNANDSNGSFIDHNADITFVTEENNATGNATTVDENGTGTPETTFSALIGDLFPKICNPATGQLGCSCNPDANDGQCEADLLVCNSRAKLCLPSETNEEGNIYLFSEGTIIKPGRVEERCNGTGIEARFWPVASREGKYVCETKPGYFWHEAEFSKAVPCDADQDGWVRITVKTYLENYPKGYALRDNARCDVRSIDRFVLRAESGLQRQILIKEIFSDKTRLFLYENETIDDDEKIKSWRSQGHNHLPLYAFNDQGRSPKANELNSLTKGCVNENADYNLNNTSDITETNNIIGDDTDNNGYLNYFAKFSYFMELNRGWYERVQDPSSNASYGQYVIQEKARLSSDPNFQLTFNHDPASSTAANWQICERFPDKGFARGATGYDFSIYGPGPRLNPLNTSAVDAAGFPLQNFSRLTPPETKKWSGMNHHSQYKCVIRESEKGSDKEEHKLVNSDFFKDPGYTFSRCFAASGDSSSQPPVAAYTETGSDGQAVTNSFNPASPVFQCEEADLRASPDKTVVWARAEYRHYPDPNDPDYKYSKGCINQCYESRGRCGLCGLGSWMCDDGSNCRLENSWLCGSFGVPKSCADITAPPGINLTDIICEDSNPVTSTFIFVSSKGSDDNPETRGTRQMPFKSIQKALEVVSAYQSPTRKVLIISSGEYKEKLTLADGVSLFGGFDMFREDGKPEALWTWLRQPAAGATVIQNDVLADGRITALEVGAIANTTKLENMLIMTIGSGADRKDIWDTVSGKEIVDSPPDGSTTQTSWPANVSTTKVETPKECTMFVDGQTVQYQNQLDYCFLQ